MISAGLKKPGKKVIMQIETELVLINAALTLPVPPLAKNRYTSY
jgi:hypothetical protein